MLIFHNYSPLDFLRENLNNYIFIPLPVLSHKKLDNIWDRNFEKKRNFTDIYRRIVL